MPRALVIHPGALGDVLLALPALAHLRTLAPDRERVVAVAPRLGALLEGSAYAEATASLDALNLHRLFTSQGDPAVLADLAGYDPIVSWFGAGESVYRRHLAELAARAGRRVIIARATPEPGAGRHASRHLLDTLAPLGPLPEVPPPVRLTARPAERQWATAWLEERGLIPGRVVLLHPGAGSPAKVWPDFPALVRRLTRVGLPVVVLTGPAETAAAGALAARAALPEARLARDLPLRGLVALLEHAALFVGNDSGLSHLAAVVGVATLVLFGPTEPQAWTPLGPRVAVLAGRGPGSRDPWEGLEAGRVEQAVLELAGGGAVEGAS
jgi:ADP-heptose:LPS heptosyltransferase